MIIRFADLQVFDILNADDLVIQWSSEGRIVFARPAHEFIRSQTCDPETGEPGEGHYTVHQIDGLSTSSFLRVKDRFNS